MNNWTEGHLQGKRHNTTQNFKNTLKIDPFNLEAAFKEVPNLLGLDQGPPYVGQITRWAIRWKSTLPEINLGQGYYA